ncbi:MAG TPA: hypothetical protein VH642_12575 [Streptosporangiaceae bacterium]|jgi:hypothetical protein
MHHELETLADPAAVAAAGATFVAENESDLGAAASLVMADRAAT